MKKIGEYELIKQIGQGAYSKVFQAYKNPNNQKVAVKMIANSSLHSNPADLIEKQIQILKQIQHPNIIRLLDIKRTKNNYYLVFEFCEKGDLERYLRKHYKGPLEERIVQRLVFEMSDALHTLHSQNIVHRDIKLANILLTSDCVTKLSDFGFARYFENQELMGSFCGTPITMAPEVLQKRAYDFKCDMWSLGVITYQLVYGKFPFVPKDGSKITDLIAILNGPDEVEFPQHPPMGEEFKKLVRWSLKKNPVERCSIDQFCSSPWVQAAKFDQSSKLEGKHDPLLNSQNQDSDVQQDQGSPLLPSSSNKQTSEAEQQKLIRIHKSVARRVYNELEEQVSRFNNDFRAQESTIEAMLAQINEPASSDIRKLFDELRTTYVQSMLQESVKVYLRKQCAEFAIGSPHQLASISSLFPSVQRAGATVQKNSSTISSVSPPPQSISQLNVLLYQCLQRYATSEKQRSKEQSAHIYKCLISLLPLFKSFSLKIDIHILQASLHSAADRANLSHLDILALRSHVVRQEFEQQNTNFIGITTEIRERNPQFNEVYSKLKSICSDRVQALEQHLY